MAEHTDASCPTSPAGSRYILDGIHRASASMSTEDLIGVLLGQVKRHLTRYENEARDRTAGLPADTSTITLRDVFQELRRTMTLSSQDWSTTQDFAVLYAIIVGWDREAMASLRARYGWALSGVERLTQMHDLVESARTGQQSNNYADVDHPGVR